MMLETACLLVLRNMISKIMMVVDSREYLSDYMKVGISTFLFPLKGYTVGYNDYSIEEINSSVVSNKYVLVNRLLDCRGIDSFREIISKFSGIKGLVFEDIGIYNLVSKLNLGMELILFQNHFNCNYDSVNFWLDRVDSVVISNELTLDEVKEITTKAKKGIVVHLYGYNQVMYSRRKLLTNWSEEFSIPFKDSNLIEDVATRVRFRVKENEFGTVMFSDKIFNGRELLDLSSIRYYYVNPNMIDHDKIMAYLANMSRNLDEDEDSGFLYRETIYKLKER